MTDLTETLKRLAERILSDPKLFHELSRELATASSAILDELERVTGRITKLEASLAATGCDCADWPTHQSVDCEAHNHMETLTAAQATITSLERELAQAKAQMRTPGARECCPDCGVTWDPEDGPWDLRLCNLNPNASPSALERYCAIKRAHSPAATPEGPLITQAEADAKGLTAGVDYDDGTW